MIVTNSNDFNDNDISSINWNIPINEQIEVINNLVSIYEQRAHNAIGNKKAYYNQIVKMLKYKLIKLQPKTKVKTKNTQL